MKITVLEDFTNGSQMGKKEEPIIQLQPDKKTSIIDKEAVKDAKGKAERNIR